jgi:hypothetical protein
MNALPETPAAGPMEMPDDIACGATRATAIMLTRRCNMTCGHCSVASGPGIKDEPAETEILARADALVAAGVRSVLLTGGEPMLRESLALELVDRLGKAGVPTSMTSNGFWGADPAHAARIVRALHRGGLRLLTISYDRFHADFMDFRPVQNIARACAAECLAMNLNITRTADDSELAGFLAEVRDLPGIRARFYDVQPVGRARHLDPGGMRANLEGFCNAAGIPAVTDDGRVMACNGPSFFQPATSPLHCSAAGTPIAEGLHRHASDPILEGLRVLGPSRLLRELSKLPAFAGFEVRDQYRGMCDLCLHLTGTPAAVEALRGHLASPSLQAEMQATRQVVKSASRELRNLPLLNEIAAPRLLFDAMFSPTHRLPPEGEQAFGRADLDWNRLLNYLGACGLSRPLLPVLEDPVIRRYAPGFFRDTVQRKGEAAATKTLLARQVLRRIARTLEEIGARGVLLKTPAIALHAAPEDHVPAPGDIDLLVLDGHAEAVRTRLLESGFEPTAERTGRRPIRHHLPTIIGSGIAVEIHHKICPPEAALPEREMLRDLLPLEGPIFRMRPEPLLLHIVSHSVRHQFRLGLKTAWAARRILETSADFDWDRMLELLRQYPCARAFWAALVVLGRHLHLPVPERVLATAPRDRIQKRLNRIARAHLFSSTGGPGEKQAFLVPALDFLVHSSFDSAAADLPRILSNATREAIDRTRIGFRKLPEASSPGDWARDGYRSLERSYRLLIAG